MIFELILLRYGVCTRLEPIYRRFCNRTEKLAVE